MTYCMYYFVFTGVIYTFIVVIILWALCTIRSEVSEKKPFISVIIAARNERNSIGSCLAALMEQDYQPELFEVVIADDRSDDGTSEVLSRFATFWDNLKILRIDKVPEDVSPKKHALSKAIACARGEIILQTDADCLVPRTWITGMVSRFTEGIMMVTGVAPYFPGPGLVNSFVRHEYLWNIALSAGSIALGYGSHASARNLAFRKDVFKRIEGYGEMKKIMSGDDTLLLHRIQKMNKSGVVTMPDKSTHVYSNSPGDFRSFTRQRNRHMSTGKYFNPVLIGTGLIVYGFHILMFSLFILSLVSHHALTLFFYGFILKVAVDSLAAWRTHVTFGLDVQLKKFIINELLLILYMTVIPIVGLFVPVKWKEN